LRQKRTSISKNEKKRSTKHASLRLKNKTCAAAADHVGTLARRRSIDTPSPPNAVLLPQSTRHNPMIPTIIELSSVNDDYIVKVSIKKMEAPQPKFACNFFWWDHRITMRRLWQQHNIRWGWCVD
jgi:hypothetical protein